MGGSCSLDAGPGDHLDPLYRSARSPPGPNQWLEAIRLSFLSSVYELPLLGQALWPSLGVGSEQQRTRSCPPGVVSAQKDRPGASVKARVQFLL